jgi:hypothetical protein
MATTIKIKDLDIIYLSYDEPNCEENWINLQRLWPKAQRVHGVKGSDAAHKACAELATTDRFVTVDGDNIVKEYFPYREYTFDDTWDIKDSILSFPAVNVVNGLRYGNGGVKVWPKHVVMNMRTHEVAKDSKGEAGVDFCWVLDYVLMPDVMSDVHMNSTPAQAWRAGFREGVKLSLIDGVKFTGSSVVWKSKIARSNFDRLCMWLQTGLDVDNGFYAILGARMGLHKTMLTDWDSSQVQDFDHLDYIYQSEVENHGNLQLYMQELGTDLVSKLRMPIDSTPFNAYQSQWIKTVFANPTRTEPKRLRG